MGSSREETTARRAVVITLHEIANDHAGGYREGFPRAAALAELAAVSTDPDLLAEAAAMHAVADNWYVVIAVDLLIEAGADQSLIDRHIDELGPYQPDQSASPIPGMSA
ncbi:hypothetical protein GCM10027280_17200 [Micromonospora polyrhachis]|uniref:Peptidase A2 domain-containing protein n=1 Tax=Micromonospora polyrhachis TaxID=1282883 RepID=A0A7W7SQC4_9ACTN|nr:hypothetical protein [Micromonospora polyrhachis]MBB4958392.1 hypothetical protein [Micromonospora polyrhachis]